MNKLESLDNRFFKAFMSVAIHGSFTTAANKEAMTQSGISQQIAKLEEQIGAPLFYRDNKQITLTEIGEQLKNYIDKINQQTQILFENIDNSKNKINGLVTYGMPNSCLLSPHFGRLLTKKKNYPELKLNVTIQTNKKIFQNILNHKIDFGFVTQKIENTSIRLIPYCEEELIIVGNHEFKGKKLDLDFIKNTGFISYPGVNDYLKTFLKLQFKRQRELTLNKIKIVASISNLTGVLNLIESGVGITLIPKHCVQDLIDNKRVFQLTNDSYKPVYNQIYIINLKNNFIPRRVNQIIDWFFEIK